MISQKLGNKFIYLLNVLSFLPNTEIEHRKASLERTACLQDKDLVKMGCITTAILQAWGEQELLTAR